MALNVHNFQPGAALHASVVGVLHSRGFTIVAMCAQLGLSMTEIRASTLGISQRAIGKRRLKQILDFVGMREVADLAIYRMERDLAELKRGVAA